MLLTILCDEDTTGVMYVASLKVFFPQLCFNNLMTVEKMFYVSCAGGEAVSTKFLVMWWLPRTSNQALVGCWF